MPTARSEHTKRKVFLKISIEKERTGQKRIKKFFFEKIEKKEKKKKERKKEKKKKN